MNERSQLIRKGFRVLVVLFSAMVMSGYVVYSHHRAQGRIRSTKSTTILEDYALIGNLESRSAFEVYPIGVPEAAQYLKKYPPLADALNVQMGSSERLTPFVNWSGRVNPEYDPLIPPTVISSSKSSTIFTSSLFDTGFSLFRAEPAEQQVIEVQNVKLLWFDPSRPKPPEETIRLRPDSQ